MTGIRHFQIIQAHITSITKTNNKNAFPVLWHITLRIDNAFRNMVPKVFFQSGKNYTKSITLIVIDQILHILKYERFRPAVSYDTGGVEEQGTL